MPRHAGPKPRVTAARLVLAVAAVVCAVGAVVALTRGGDTPPAAPQVDLTAPPSTSAGDRVTVVGVADAVTLDVRLPDGRDVVRVRALGIQGPGPCYADDSTSFARQVLSGQAVDLVADGGAPAVDDAEVPAAAVDRFDRRLQRVVLAGGRDYAVLAAEAGIARTYSVGASPQAMPPVRDAEARARAAGRGLWGPPCGGRE